MIAHHASDVDEPRVEAIAIHVEHHGSERAGRDEHGRVIQRAAAQLGRYAGDRVHRPLVRRRPLARLAVRRAVR